MFRKCGAQQNYASSLRGTSTTRVKQSLRTTTALWFAPLALCRQQTPMLTVLATARIEPFRQQHLILYVVKLLTGQWRQFALRIKCHISNTIPQSHRMSRIQDVIGSFIRAHKNASDYRHSVEI